MVMRGEMVACATFYGGSTVDEIIRATRECFTGDCDGTPDAAPVAAG